MDGKQKLTLNLGISIALFIFFSYYWNYLYQGINAEYHSIYVTASLIGFSVITLLVMIIRDSFKVLGIVLDSE